ncbi:hypothetical protein Q6A49_03035 [Pseudomonas sp. 22-AL-CL-001]|uniref:hypothetical protein n=1 Tax=Pseudomonas alabamensis TaxID=3064349 RepID=UPI00271356AF|nr:hypothetical protein [Pseudomonas sp. 22-AL-CL-001]MDO7909502.1 hypothetical protein [Pseudomonas sp. 22-AL-CL-001]
MNENTPGLFCFYDKRGYITIKGYMTGREAKINAEIYGLDYCPGDGDYRKHYVKDGQVVDRPKLALVVSGTTIKGIPQGAEILVEDMRYVADGTDIHLTFTGAQLHQVLIKLWPYQDEELSLANQPQE